LIGGTDPDLTSKLLDWGLVELIVIYIPLLSD